MPSGCALTDGEHVHGGPANSLPISQSVSLWAASSTLPLALPRRPQISYSPSPLRVCVPDLEKAARDVVASSYRNAGQTCICTNRAFVHVRQRRLWGLPSLPSSLLHGIAEQYATRFLF